jgi:hypothetical protein
MFSVDDFAGESSCSAPWYLMPSGEEIAHALIGVAVHATKHRSTRPIAEVV